MKLRTVTFLLGAFGGLWGIGCDGNPVSTTGGGGGSGGTGTGGEAGSAGGGGAGGADTCPAPHITKGPWALAVDATSAVVRWERCASDPAPLVEFTEEGGAGRTSTTMASETQVTLTETYTAPLNKDAPPDLAGTYFIEEAKLEGLTPGACYTFQLEADPERKGRVCAARAPGEALSFAAIGDTNPGLGHTKGVLEHTLTRDFDFTIHGGDIQYYESGLETWAYWFPQMQPLLSRGAFFPAIGNHESEKNNELSDYALRFFGGAGFDGGQTYYRFENAGIHFFSLNTEEPIGQGSAEATWLESRLADAKATPGFRFSVVFFHRPLFTCGDSGDDAPAAAHLVPIFEANDVRLVLQAHMHGYERFEMEDGITYITAAGGGGLMGNVDENTTRPYCDKRVASGPYFHAVIFSVDAGSLSGEVVSEDGTVVDTFSKPIP